MTDQQLAKILDELAERDPATAPIIAHMRANKRSEVRILGCFANTMRELGMEVPLIPGVTE